jgi:hypothetical protein
MRSQGLLGAILIAVAIFVFFALVMPAYDEIKVVQQAVEERQAMLTDLESALSKVKKLQGEMDGNSADVKKAGNVITGPKNSDEVLVALEAMAAESGVQISNVRISDGKREGEFETTSVQLDGGGAYSSVQLLLEKLEANARLFDVKTISLSEGGASSLRFNIVMSIYHLE